MHWLSAKENDPLKAVFFHTITRVSITWKFMLIFILPPSMWSVLHLWKFAGSVSRECAKSIINSAVWGQRRRPLSKEIKNKRVNELWKTCGVYPATKTFSQRVLSCPISMPTFCMTKDRKGESLVLAKSLLKNNIHPVGSCQHRIVT